MPKYLDIDEVNRRIDMASAFTVYGLTMAKGEDEKQFILERIAEQLGFEVEDIRKRFGADAGKKPEGFDKFREMFDKYEGDDKDGNG